MLKPAQILSIRKSFKQCPIGFGAQFSPRVSAQTVEQWEAGKLPMLRHQAELITQRAAAFESTILDCLERARKLADKTNPYAHRFLYYVTFLSDAEFVTYNPDVAEKFGGWSFLYSRAISEAFHKTRYRPGYCHIKPHTFNAKSYLRWLKSQDKKHKPALLSAWAEDDTGYASKKSRKLLPDELSAKLREIDQAYRVPSPLSPPPFQS